MATTISGRVTVEGGTPAPDAVVELHNATDDIVTQITVDEQGHYTFHVSEGAWQLKAWDPYGHRGDGQARVSTGEDKRLDLGLD
jgi:hypothetical protein